MAMKHSNRFGHDMFNVLFIQFMLRYSNTENASKTSEFSLAPLKMLNVYSETAGFTI